MPEDDEQRETQLLRREVDASIATALRQKRRFKQGAADRGELESAVIDLYETLSWFKTEDSIEEEWAERDLDVLEQLMSQWKQPSKTTHPRCSTPRSSKPELQISQASDKSLLNFIDDLLAVAKELGFAPNISSPTTRTEITKDDMEEFEEWRQQVKSQ